MDSPGSLDAFLSERQARHTGFMLLVHKFPINGARISRRPSRSCWSTRSIVFSEIFLDLFFAFTGYLSFVRLPVSAVPPAAFLRPADAVAAARSSPHRDRPSVYERVSRRVASVTREEIFEFIDRRYLPPIPLSVAPTD